MADKKRGKAETVTLTQAGLKLDLLDYGHRVRLEWPHKCRPPLEWDRFALARVREHYPETRRRKLRLQPWQPRDGYVEAIVEEI